jgi:predicted DNA-binding transcriptional regulator AlpA
MEIITDMDINQSRVIELLREVHLVAYKEIERLNLRVAELEQQVRHRDIDPLLDHGQHPKKLSFEGQRSEPVQPEAQILNEKEAAAYLSVSVALLRKWRLFRQGPSFLRIGRLVRYRRVALESWLDSCSE